MRNRVALASLLVAAWLAAVMASPAYGGAEPVTSGFRALSGEPAASVVLPDDVELVKSFDLPAYGLTYERYQQFFGKAHAEVLGGQLTLYRDGAGEVVMVIGAHYPNITPTNQARRSGDDARRDSEQDVGRGEKVNIDLLINPETGRYFHRVETRRFASRWFHWIDADDGEVLNKYDGLQTDDGKGVKGDTKDINGPSNPNGTDQTTNDDLTTLHNAADHGAAGAHWDLFSADARQKTFDNQNFPFLFFHYTTDDDNHWNTVGRTSPGQPALVDAQYYASVADKYFLDRHDFDWTLPDNLTTPAIEGCGYPAMLSVAHYDSNYNNAFWDGTYLVYGDGDGAATFRELSGGLDVVAHEATHGITECTSNLVYYDESGALNESFSDMLGNSAEFFANTNVLDAAVSPDWWIGEDVYLPADTVPGFRNMADPREDGHPDHYSELYTGPDDNGGVHSNSGIPNHAFYLLVNGGKNAGCDTVGPNGHTHTDITHPGNCAVSVTGIDRVKAEKVFFVAFTGLPENATMRGARLATQVVADSLLGPDLLTPLLSPAERQSVRDAWQAVGVLETRPCDSTVTSLPFESAHNYSDEIDCVWTYQNSSANFSFKFSRVDLEPDYDYIYILDANNKVLQTITGSHPTGLTTVNIPTQIGKVRLVTDQFVTDWGFKVVDPAAPTDHTKDLYVWDIVFESKVRGGRHDERMVVTVRRDSDGDGVAESADAVVSGASVNVLLDGTWSFSGTTGSTGVFRTTWITGVPAATHSAEVTALAKATYAWNQALDPVSGRDTDLYPANNKPEQQHNVPHY